MVCFNDLPSEIIDAVLEHLDQASLSSTAIVSSSLQHPSEQFLYHTVKFRLLYGPPSDHKKTAAQETFLRTVSLTERRARHVNLLALQKIDYDEDEERATRFGDLEGAFKSMVNLKKLSVIGTAYIRLAGLRSPTFSLTHLCIDPSCSYDEPNPNEALFPILKAHPELRCLLLRGLWSLTRDDIAEIEEQRCNESAYPSAILCPRLEYVDVNSSSEEVLQSLLYGRRIKHVVMARMSGGAVEERWGSVSMLPAYSRLETLILIIGTKEIDENSLPITMAQHLISLTRLRIGTSTNARYRPPAQIYTPDPVILSISHIQTLKSLALSGNPHWCNPRSDEQDMVRFLYKSCPRLKETFVRRVYGPRSHAYYGLDGNQVGIVGDIKANSTDYKPTRMFG